MVAPWACSWEVRPVQIICPVRIRKIGYNNLPSTCQVSILDSLLCRMFESKSSAHSVVLTDSCREIYRDLGNLQANKRLGDGTTSALREPAVTTKRQRLFLALGVALGRISPNKRRSRGMSLTESA